MIPFAYLCHRLLSSAFVRFWLLALPSYLFHDFHLLEPLPLRQRKGFFFPPKHSHEKFFRKFFQIYPRRLFADFLARICDEGECLPAPCNRGGTLFLWACGLPSFRFSFPFPFLFSSFPCCSGYAGGSGSFPCCVPSILVGFRSLLAGSIGGTPAPSGRLVLLCSSFCWAVRGFPASVLPRSCLDPAFDHGFPRELEDLTTGAKRLKIG